MTWEIFKRAFPERSFPRELRESKVELFINVRQGVMSVVDYYLKFTKFSKYSTSLVSNPRDDMSHFVKGVSENLVEECRLAVLHDNMYISCSWIRLNKLKK